MFNYHMDPGHGWVEVPWTALKELGLNPTNFTRFSYRRGNTFFLEEDCDATRFGKAYEAKHGTQPTFSSVMYECDAPIRRFNPIY